MRGVSCSNTRAIFGTLSNRFTSSVCLYIRFARGLPVAALLQNIASATLALLAGGRVDGGLVRELATYFSARRSIARILFAGAVLLLFAGCGNDPSLSTGGVTVFFTQDYNPPYLDVLWVLDNRSPMSNDRDPLNQQASEFFQRLDASTSQYQMAMVTADMQYARGALQPQGNPVVLTKGLGTLDQRVAAFSSLIYQTINLNTGPQDAGFASALAALQNGFVPRSNVPLVIVFISYSDDHSTVPVANEDDVIYYSQAYLALKGGQQNLLRVYSVNYFPQPAQRCAVQYNAEIDESGFQNTYFRMAAALGGDKADLCSDFASQIDLTGLRQKQLASSFTLEKAPGNPSSIAVSVSQNGQAVTGLTWHYDASATAIVFDQPPPEGSSIQVTYN